MRTIPGLLKALEELEESDYFAVSQDERLRIAERCMLLAGPRLLSDVDPMAVFYALFTLGAQASVRWMRTDEAACEQLLNVTPLEV